MRFSGVDRTVGRSVVLEESKDAFVARRGRGYGTVR